MEDFRENLLSSVENVHHSDDCMSLVKAYRRVCAIVAVVAMSPAMLKGTEPVKAMPLDAEQLTEIIAAPSQEKEVSTINFHQAPSRLKKFLGDDRVLYKKSFVSDGIKYTMYYSNGGLYDPADRENFVTDVIFVPSDYDYVQNENVKPPWLTKLIYHDLGPDKEFIGAKIKYIKSEPDEFGFYYNNYYEKEIRLPDEIANEITHMFSGDTKFYFNNPVPLEVVKTAALQKEREL